MTKNALKKAINGYVKAGTKKLLPWQTPCIINKVEANLYSDILDVLAGIIIEGKCIKLKEIKSKEEAGAMIFEYIMNAYMPVKIAEQLPDFSGFIKSRYFPDVQKMCWLQVQYKNPVSWNIRNDIINKLYEMNYTETDNVPTFGEEIYALSVEYIERVVLEDKIDKKFLIVFLSILAYYKII